MKTNNNRYRGRVILSRKLCSGAAFTALAMLAAGATVAQDSGNAVETLDEIIITGSRIPRSGFETLQPATVLDGEKLDLRGNISLATSLNEQAGFVTPLNSPVSSQDSFSVGQNFVDYLGLGQQRTLTLVNGNRFPAGVAPNGTGGLSVDLNAIPDNLVERIETIAIGGAPIYGSDAIAGTVNIILMDDFEGLEFVASGGGSLEHNDAGQVRFGATWGNNFDDGRGNITLSGQYTSADGLLRVDRAATATAVGFQSPGDPDSPYDLQLFPDLTVAVDNVTAFPLYWGNQFGFGLFPGAGNEDYVNGLAFDINDPNTPISQFDANGNLLPFVPGGGTGTPIFQNGGDGLKVPHFTALYTDIERYNFTLLSKYELTDSLRFVFEGWFARTEATELINQSGYNSPAFGGLPGDGDRERRKIAVDGAYSGRQSRDGRIKSSEIAADSTNGAG
jgi:iron complex outermembrane receptor protein